MPEKPALISCKLRQRSLKTDKRQIPMKRRRLWNVNFHISSATYEILSWRPIRLFILLKTFWLMRNNWLQYDVHLFKLLPFILSQHNRPRWRGQAYFTSAFCAMSSSLSIKPLSLTTQTAWYWGENHNDEDHLFLSWGTPWVEEILSCFSFCKGRQDYITWIIYFCCWVKFKCKIKTLLLIKKDSISAVEGWKVLHSPSPPWGYHRGLPSITFSSRSLRHRRHFFFPLVG